MKAFDIEGIKLAEYQAQIFEKSISKFNCSSPVFIRRFLHSTLLQNIDKNNLAFLSMSVDEALDSINLEFGDTEYGKEKYSSDEMFWLGYFYRYISYTREIDTKLLFKLFDYKKIVNLFYTYHTQDFEWCLQNILELNNYSEDIFDPNYRLKEVIRKKGK